MGTGTFCSLEGTADECLFAGNDLADAESGHDFREYGNVPPAQ